MLGRPWERTVRCTWTNKDHGTLRGTMQSLDSLRKVTFCAVSVDNPRNRLSVSTIKGDEVKSLHISADDSNETIDDISPKQQLKIAQQVG